MKYIVNMRNPKTGKAETYEPIATRQLYRISADGGTSWTEQWLTSQEAAEESKKYLCEQLRQEARP